jgi:predicted nucleic acid-binding protein
MIDTRDERRAAARAWVAGGMALITSVLAEVEVTRAALRLGASLRTARAAVERCSAIDLTAEIRVTAGQILPENVRSLDAIHVASALAAGVHEFASFDSRQTLAAERAGLKLARILER